MQWECSPTESALDLGYGKFKRLWFILRDNQIVQKKPNDNLRKMINSD